MTAAAPTHPVKRELRQLLLGVGACIALLALTYAVMEGLARADARQQQFHANAQALSGELSSTLTAIAAPPGVAPSFAERLDNEVAFVASVTRDVRRADALLDALIALHRREADPAFAAALRRLGAARTALLALQREHGDSPLALARAVAITPLYASVVTQQLQRQHAAASAALQARLDRLRGGLTAAFALVLVAAGAALAWQTRRSLRSIDTILASERRSLDELGASRSALARSRDELEQQVIDRTRQLTLARDAAEHANRAKSEFLSRMSHELRTPMNAVLGFAQLMALEPGQPPRVQGFLDHILRAGKHLLHLINDVLDLAHVESGRLTLSPEPLEVEAIVREVAALMQPLADQHGVTLATQLAAGSVVRGDRLRLKQVLLNLVSNAIKYNRPGGEVRVGAEAQADGSTRITIADTGQGIAPEGMAQLFEPFARLGHEQGSIEGTGIGLSISKRLVEMMGGRIGAASRLGEGSRFWIDLPGDRLAPGPAPRTTDFGEFAEPSVERPALVLYVEDNPANVDLMRHIVDRHVHIRLITAPSAALGLDLARSHRPDLILMDIHLPDVSGYTALARLQGDPATRDIPVMAITANAMPGESAKALDAGFVDYLTKPLDVSRFDALLRGALRARPGA